MKIICIGGGTAGHLNPAISTLQKLIDIEKKQNQTSNHKNKYYLATDFRCKEYIFNLEKEINLNFFDIKKPSKNIIDLFYLIFNYLKCFLEIFHFFIKIKPDIVIGFGGYVSVLFILIAKLLNIKTIIHEQNIIPGKATKLLKNFADYTAISFENTKNYLLTKNFCSNFYCQKNLKIITIGNPIRNEFTKIIEKKFSTADKFTILVFGGSQAAQVFDEIIPTILNKINQKIKVKNTNFQLKIIHQARSCENLIKQYKNFSLFSEVSRYFHDMNAKYDEADLVISRAGAATIFEIIQKAQPSILIPFPSSYCDHQLLHAKYLSNLHASWILEQNSIQPNLENLILSIIENRQILIEYSKNLTTLQDDWTQNMCNLVLKHLKS